MAGLVQNLLATVCTTFGIGPKGARATLDASGLTSARTLNLPDASGTLLVNGHYDGGNASSVYTSAQHTFDGGSASG